MGTRYTWIEACPKCQAELECSFVKNGGITIIICGECGEEFEVAQSLFLKPTSPKGEYGGWKEVKNMNKLEKGMIVELKSGGPKMTVVSIDPDAKNPKGSICCHWSSGSKFQSGLFHPECLKNA